MTLNDKLFSYLQLKVKNFNQIHKLGKTIFTCPKIEQHKFPSKNPTAEFLPNSDKIACLICGFKGNTYDVIRILEEDKKNKSDAEIGIYLDSLLGTNEYKEFEQYEKYNWSLIPILRNSKQPFEKNWTEIEHKDKIQWIKWINSGLNIGLNCGKSNIMVIDMDFLSINSEIRNKLIIQLIGANTLMQKTPHGQHYIFKLDSEIPQTVNIAGLKIDTRVAGGQILLSPSKIDKTEYSWINLGTEIKEISLELKSNLLELIKVDESRTKERINELEIKTVNEGEGRNNVLTSIGGVLINKFNADDVAYILSLISKNFMNPPLAFHEIKAMLGSLSGYKISEDETQEKTIYNYMRQMQTDITPKDVIDNTHYPRAIVDKWLSKFVKEGKAVRLGRGRYQYKEKVEWSDAITINVDEYKYKIPLFNDIALFQEGDVLLLGGKTNEGKTTISLNIIRDLITQGIKPYYCYSEAGSRFQKTAKILGIDGKFYHTYHTNPLAIELEENSVTIIDWLHLENKAETDTVLKHLNDEVQRKKGILIIFTQLKQDYSYFAPNLIDHFPTFAGRYIQDNDNHTEGHWQCDKIKEPRGNYITYLLPCIYDRETKIFKLKDII